MTTTSEKILQSIKEAHISPAPRWKFLVKNSAFWIMFGGALVVGALAFSVIIDLLVNHDWDIYTYLHKSFLQYLIFSLPYVWIICVALFSRLTYYYFVHTKGWYHHRVYRVVLASILLSVGLGMVFFSVGFGKQIDQTLASKIPYYEVMSLDKNKLWSHPDDGLLSGEVAKISDENYFTIKDHSGKEWIVEKASVQNGNPTVVVGERVKIIGKEKNPQTFEAQEIRRWDSQTRKNLEDKNLHAKKDDGSSE